MAHSPRAVDLEECEDCVDIFTRSKEPTIIAFIEADTAHFAALAKKEKP